MHNFLHGNMVIHCQTAEEKTKLLYALDERGWRWNNGDGLIKNDGSCSYGCSPDSDECYYLCRGFKVLHGDYNEYTHSGNTLKSYGEVVEFYSLPVLGNCEEYAVDICAGTFDDLF